MNPIVDFYFTKNVAWQQELQTLRTIVLSCGLTETLKWGTPCYTHNNTNILLLHVFKDYCAILFFKGALLQNTEGLLIQQTKNVQAARQIRFTNTATILQKQQAVISYIYEAIAVEQAGLKVTLKKPEAFEMVAAFKEQLATVAGLQKAFEALTPGRQRAYLLYFSAAKQLKTQEARVGKCVPNILKGIGLQD